MSINKPIVVVAVCLGALAANWSAAFAQEGRFEALPIEASWGSDGRTMKVLKPFAFIDKSNVRWSVPSGTETDGASIPRQFWTIMGGPFEGSYRDAAVVHDRYCDLRTRRWEDTHAMFYDAMLATGVGSTRAWLMYKAVERFGPRWPEPVVPEGCRLPDGRIDYIRCTQNTTKQGDKWFPELNKAELEKFLTEVAPRADAKDIEAVRSKAQDLPR
jgi:Protein of unknown function (DUF1353)